MKSGIPVKNCLAMVAALAVIAACSAKNSMSEMAVSADYAARTEAAEAPRAVPGEATPVYRENDRRKLIKRANLSVRTEDLAAADVSINALMEKHGAYAASTETSENYRAYNIRVPAPAYDSFLAGMEGMGRTLRRSESAEDVTLRYYDLEGRLATKQELLKTFQAYLNKAKNIEEILSVEARIAELQSEIDRSGTELTMLANQVDYATVNLEIYGPVAAESYRGATLAERIKKLLSGFGEFLSAGVVVITGVVIYGVPLVLLFVFLFWLLFGKIGLLKKLFRAAAGKKEIKNTEKIIP